jgi:hypothetical protein
VFIQHFSSIGGVSVLASEMCKLEPRNESLTRRLLEGMEGKGKKGREGGNGLSQQGHGPKTVEATI